MFQPGTKPGYIGGLREDQFAFLQAYLGTLRKDRLLVLGMHIPLFDAAPGRETFRHADRTRLFALLREFPPVLVLSGHSHTQQHYYHGADEGWTGASPLHEYNVGAACGAFWSGIKDAAGIPDATMSDGTPNGYAVLSVRKAGRMRWITTPPAIPTTPNSTCMRPRCCARARIQPGGVRQRLRWARTTAWSSTASMAANGSR